MNKEYKIKFTTDYEGDEEESDMEYWKHQKRLFKKYNGKTIKLLDIPALIDEARCNVVLSKEEVEIYNNHRE